MFFSNKTKRLEDNILNDFFVVSLFLKRVPLNLLVYISSETDSDFDLNSACIGFIHIYFRNMYLSLKGEADKTTTTTILCTLYCRKRTIVFRFTVNVLKRTMVVFTYMQILMFVDTAL